MNIKWQGNRAESNTESDGEQAQALSYPLHTYETDTRPNRTTIKNNINLNGQVLISLGDVMGSVKRCD